MNHVNIVGRLTTTPQKIEENKREIYIQTKRATLDDKGNIGEKLTTHKAIVYGRYVPIVDAFGSHLYDLAIEGHLEDGVVIVNDLITL